MQSWRVIKAGGSRRFFSSAAEQQLPGSLKSYVRAIKDCQTLNQVQDIHTQVLNRGLKSHFFLNSCLVHRYLHLGSVLESWALCPQLHDPDVITWTRLIAAFSQKGELNLAFRVFREMQNQGVFPDNVTLITMLNTCAKFGALDQGKEIHSLVLESGFELVSLLGNSLVDLYAKCSELDEACRAFSSLKLPDVVSWNTLIAAYATCSDFLETVRVYERMQLEGMKPDGFTLVTVLSSCTGASSSLSTVDQIRYRALELGLSSGTLVSNALMNCYGRLGLVTTAKDIFESSNRDVISWNVMMSAYTLAGMNPEAVKLYWRMQHEGVHPEEAAFLTIVNACTGLEDLSLANLISSNIAESSSCSSNHQVGNSLIGMFGRCGSVADAQVVFEKLRYREVVSWNSLVAAFSVNGFSDRSLELYHQMQLEGILPNNITFASVLNACNEEPLLRFGRSIHACVDEAGYGSAEIVACALVDMYCKCNSLERARRVFGSSKKSVALYTALMGGYSEGRDSGEAMKLLHTMQLEGLRPNKITLVTVMNALANSARLNSADERRMVHSLVMESSSESDLAVRNALLNLFGRSGELQASESLFQTLEYCDTIAATVMVSAYSHQGLWRRSVQTYHTMLLQGLKPSSTTFQAVLTSCSALASLPVGKPVHASIVESGCSRVPVVQNSLINFYSKCGSLKLARELFEAMEEKNMVVAWTAIIAGYAQHGEMRQARKMFQRMQQEGGKPDDVTFITVLSVCSHNGLVEDACHFFVAMTKELEIPASIEHYGCMIDLLGRTGWLNEAESLVKRMKVEPDAVMWTALLGSSRVHGNLKLAKHAAQQVMKLEPGNAASYVQLSNVTSLGDFQYLRDE